ncbi:MAG: metallophosphoesterase family protein [Betaproteobacteria bacterium]
MKIDSGGSARAAPRRRLLRALAAAALALAAGGAAAAESAAPLRVVVISDLNESYGSTRYADTVLQAVRRIEAIRPALVISTGDMVAGQRLAPPLTRPELEAMWAAFHRAVSDPLARAGLPLAVTPGNHDAAAGTRFRLEREVFRAQWLPRKPALDFVDAAGYPFHYAFAVGPVLFVSLDATAVGHLPEREKRWLADLLERHGDRYKFRVVYGHLPLWPFAEGRATEYLGDTELERLLQRHRVDLVLSGHHHAYYPGAKDGVRYVSQACLGAAPRPLLGSDRRAEHAITVLEFPVDGPPSVEAYRAPHYTEKIDRHTLPERIVSPRATLLRDDLAAKAGAAARP